MNALKATLDHICSIFASFRSIFTFFDYNLAIFRVNIKNGCFRVANRLIMAVVKSLVLD